MSSPFQLWTDGVAAVSGTRPKPTTDGTEGVDLGGVRSFHIIISADTGKVLDGTGGVEIYLWSAGLARWVENPDLYFPITSTNKAWANVRDRVCADFSVGVPGGRFVPRVVGVGVDSGNVTTQAELYSG